MTLSQLPFWLVNVPEDQWPADCPDFLVNANARDRRILGTQDKDYHILTWPEVKGVIRRNGLDDFRRVPSSLRRYLEYTARLKNKYGTVMDFVLSERLTWTTLKPKGIAPFSDPEDIKILYNDWPYGIDSKIVHLVVWTKFDLEDDPATGDLTLKARTEINDFVDQTFGSEVDSEHVLWFRNWSSLKSIHAIEHFHVMLYDPPPEFVKEITNGDVPLSEKVNIT